MQDKEIPDMKSIHKAMARCRHDTSAVTALEYGMIAALIAVVVISGFTTLGVTLSTTMSTIAAVFPAG
jgi:pilus assembly protein Flp/PilA